MNAPTPAVCFETDAQPYSDFRRPERHRPASAVRLEPELSPEEAALQPFGEPVRRSSLAALLTDLAHRVAHILAARQAAQHLHALDDRLLADMGLTRGSIDAVVLGHNEDPRERW
ncbi:DUF1127 domain-containing protein [Salinarimonas rosea]|uniref:DUF1127 domain-containing protein n=1 Tax=Salinarimonas rosea TaxID=552063 RepID=UPI0003FC286C|nr:DUF1127 domain-containing protein [Salinarimonas rosea]